MRRWLQNFWRTLLIFQRSKQIPWFLLRKNCQYSIFSSPYRECRLRGRVKTPMRWIKVGANLAVWLSHHLHLTDHSAGEASIGSSPTCMTSPRPESDSFGTSRAPLSSPPPLFLSESGPTNPPTPVKNAVNPSHASPSPLVNTPMTDEEVEACTRSSWLDKIRQLNLFGNNSWGSAYQTIAEVKLVLRIGKKYRMTPTMHAAMSQQVCLPTGMVKRGELNSSILDHT